MSGAVEFRVGTAWWTDPTLLKSDLFYPPSVRSAEERLRFYAEQFNTVEIDSTYYALPSERNDEAVDGAHTGRVRFQYQTVRADDVASCRDVASSKAVA